MKCYGIHQALIWFAVGGVLCVVGGILFIFMPDIIDAIMGLVSLLKHFRLFIKISIFKNFKTDPNK